MVTLPVSLAVCVCVYARACVENRYGRSTHTSEHVLAVRPLSYYLALCFNAPAKQAFGASERAFERQRNNYSMLIGILKEFVRSTRRYKITYCCGLNKYEN